jgi:GNAT superfamily N-acetyltransferase
MAIIVKKVDTKKELEQFIRFPWRVLKNDPHWVPPLLNDRRDKLEFKKNSFWKNADRELFIAYQNGAPAGTIIAIHDRYRQERFNEPLGMFGFFDCINDREIAQNLFQATTAWLKDRDLTSIRGPYNPSTSDEVGILVEGYDTIPALLEAHNPSYYPALFTDNGFRKYQDIVARHIFHPPEAQSLADVLPEKIIRVGEMVQKRLDLKIRPVNIKNWESEIHLATDLYNQALDGLPEFTPISFEEFLTFANSFKPIMDPAMALIADVSGKPVGFALALPDFNQAFLHLNGRMDLIGTLKLLWYSRKIDRATFKILVMIPEYQRRGIETALVLEVCKTLWKKNYREVDMSLTGDENEKSNRYQDNLGMKIYRRYRVYEKEI